MTICRFGSSDECHLHVNNSARLILEFSVITVFMKQPWLYKADFNGLLLLHQCTLLTVIFLFIICHFHSARHCFSTSAVCCSCNRVSREQLFCAKGGQCIPH